MSSPRNRSVENWRAGTGTDGARCALPTLLPRIVDATQDPRAHDTLHREFCDTSPYFVVGVAMFKLSKVGSRLWPRDDGTDGRRLRLPFIM
jgi:hypothetical protein